MLSPGGPKKRDGLEVPSYFVSNCTSGAEVPKEPVVPYSVAIGDDAVGREQLGLPTGAIVPIGTPRGDGEISPSVSRAECSQIHVARPAPVTGYEGVWRARVAMTDRKPVDWRHERKHVKRASYIQRPMDLMPPCRPQTSRRSTSADLRKPVLGGPRERAILDGESVMQRTQASTHGADRGGWVCSPSVIDRVQAGQAGCHDPAPGFVGALVQQPRNRSKGDGPRNSSSFRS